jgi:hypothetical protein
MSIKIQAGKYYRRRDGEVIGPAKHRGDKGSSYQWNVSGNYYTDDGRYQACGPDSPYDLIAEVTVTDVLPFELKAGGKYETVNPDGTVGPVVELARTSYAYGYLREAFPFSHGSPTEVVFDRHGCGFQLDARVTPDSYRCFRITAPYVAPPPTTVERLEAWRDRYVDRVCNHHEWSGELAAIIADLKHTESRPKDSTAG